jgi:hypothetical protein
MAQMADGQLTTLPKLTRSEMVKIARGYAVHLGTFFAILVIALYCR